MCENAQNLSLSLASSLPSPPTKEVGFALPNVYRSENGLTKISRFTFKWGEKKKERKCCNILTAAEKSQCMFCAAEIKETNVTYKG